MKQIYFDCETTSKDIYQAEIIEAFFLVVENNSIVDEYTLKAKPDNWSLEAELIHGISYQTASLYPEKNSAYKSLLNWLPSDFCFINYANTSTIYGHINYDVGVLRNELSLVGCKNYLLENTYKMSKPVSVHTIAKQCASAGLFTPVKNKTGRDSFTQSNVFYALFKDTYNYHNAKEDVLALYKIHNELIRLQNEQSTAFNFG